MSTFLHDIEFLGLTDHSRMVAIAANDWLFAGHLVLIAVI
jgi:hypothetical protein